VYNETTCALRVLPLFRIDHNFQAIWGGGGGRGLETTVHTVPYEAKIAGKLYTDKNEKNVFLHIQKEI
jgi:hypothetical protein